MRIVINIDDEDYDDITLTGENTINLGVLLDLREAVRKGTPLPKGHGDLIDRNELISDAVWDDREEDFVAVSCKQIEDAEVIVKADEVES